MAEALGQGAQRGAPLPVLGGPGLGGGKAMLQPHALALYQQQITMAHGESSLEAKQQQQQQPLVPGQQLKQQQQQQHQQSYPGQAERERAERERAEALRSSSPRMRPRSPTPGNKDGRAPEKNDENQNKTFPPPPPADVSLAL